MAKTLPYRPWKIFVGYGLETLTCSNIERVLYRRAVELLRTYCKRSMIKQPIAEHAVQQTPPLWIIFSIPPASSSSRRKTEHSRRSSMQLLLKVYATVLPGVRLREAPNTIAYSQVPREGERLSRGRKLSLRSLYSRVMLCRPADDLFTVSSKLTRPTCSQPWPAPVLPLHSPETIRPSPVFRKNDDE
jgi:hypothetical protein